MKECDVLHNKIAYFIEIQLVQMLSASESFELFDFLAFLFFDFWTFCKEETSVGNFAVDVS